MKHILDLVKNPRFAITVICDADYNSEDQNRVRALITVADVEKLHDRAGD